MLTCGAAVQRWLCRSAGQSIPCGLPMPGQQLVKSVDRGPPRDHPLEHIRQVGLRVEVVQLRRVDQTGQDRPRPGPALTPGEECILTAKCNLLVILPISGRKSWSIIAGIPSTGVAFASAAVSSVSPGGSCRSKRSPASSRLWRRGCSIRSRAQAWRSASAGYQWTRSSNCIVSSASEAIGEAPRTT